MKSNVPSTKKPSLGVLNLEAGEKKFSLTRHEPAEELRFFIQRYWIVSWDLRGQDPYRQDVLPHPCVNLVFDKGKTAVFGVSKGKFSYLLQGKGRVFGVKFKPGAFYPFLQSPVSRLYGRSIDVREVFDIDVNALEQTILSQKTEAGAVELANQFFCDHLPEHDENVARVNRIVEEIKSERKITRVDDVVDRFHINKRTLQRLFNQYVGVSPKWVIKRYRLHEAAEHMAKGGMIDWPHLAFALGYFDQAHFIKDFKSLVGISPQAYLQQVEQNEESKE